MGNSASSLILALNGFTFSLEQKSHQRRLCGKYCLDVSQLHDFIKISVASSKNTFLKYFPDNLHIISPKCIRIERAFIETGWLGKYNLSLLVFNESL